MPTTDYAVIFTAKVSWDGRANGFPEELYAYLFFKGYDRAIFEEAIKVQSDYFLNKQAFFCQSDQDKIVDIRQATQGMLVPLHWIVSIKVDVKRINGEITLADEQGVERREDGEEPVKQ